MSFFREAGGRLIHLCQILSPPYLRNVLLQDIMRACMRRGRIFPGIWSAFDDGDDDDLLVFQVFVLVDPGVVVGVSVVVGWFRC